MFMNALLVVLALTIPPVNDSRVVDQAGLLNDSQVQELAAVIHRIEVDQGVKAGFLTVTALDDDPKAVAVRTLNFWQLGPDSVLLLISTNPKKIFLQPGTNLQYRFNEATSVGLIRDAIAPAMKAGRYGTAVLNGFHAISNALPGPRAAPPPNTATRPEPKQVAVAGDGPSGLLIFVVASGAILLMFLLARKVRRDQEERLAKVREEEEDRARAQRSYAQSVKTQAPAPTQLEPAATRYVPSPFTDKAPVNVVVNNPAPSSNNDLLTGLLIGEQIAHANQPVRVEPTRYVPPPSPPRPRYTPAPPAPPSPPRYSSYSSDDSSSGSGGGGYDYGSSSSDSSSGGGGGGSDW